MTPKLLIISHLEQGDTTFDSDVGSWNVTRAKRDCDAGKYPLYRFEVAEVLANNANIEVDEAKIASMIADRARLSRSPPPIFAEENGRIWLIDGHHRLHALDRLGEPEFVAYVIEEQDAEPYRLYFNGERVAPWMKQQGAKT